MDVLKKQEHYAELLLIYQKLLTENIRQRMEAFYFDNLSLSEIAENEGVSRNAVHLSIQSGERELDRVENSIGLAKIRKNLFADFDALSKAESKEERDMLIQKMKGEF
jgi:predicted DNA-binding protein YlxM (UPF0122 family)